jgi:hypothetical protein
MESPRYNHARNATDFATAWIRLRLLLPCENIGTERVELSLIQGMSLCNTNIACVPIEMVAD